MNGTKISVDMGQYSNAIISVCIVAASGLIDGDYVTAVNKNKHRHSDGASTGDGTRQHFV